MAESSKPSKEEPFPRTAGVEGERKVISVLFTDVVNYTTLAEKLDIEVVHDIIDSHFKILTDAVDRRRQRRGRDLP